MNKNFHLEISEPSIVAQGKPGDDAWGKTQFPGLRKTENGKYYANWYYGADDIYYDTINLEAVSCDGVSWQPKSKDDKIVFPKMKNGNYFEGFIRQGTHKVDYMDKYTPIFTTEATGGKRFFLLVILPKPKTR